MGALPPISPWIPEDDLLLKKAVEDGASLESLAKGAIRFSRRFTIRELQERWYSLLYDPEISFEASERMMEVERSNCGLASNKSNKGETSKESIEGQKRKFESVRRFYYAMRKKIRSDPLNQGDLNFFVPPVENFYGHGNEVTCPSNILEDPMASHFGIGNTFDGMHHVYPEDIGNNTDDASRKYDVVDKGQLENHPIEQGNLFEGNMFTDLEGNHVFSSPVSECEASFHHLQYSSPPPAMPDWRNSMEMVGDSHLRGKAPQIGDPFRLPDETGKSSSEYDLVHSDNDFEAHIVCNEMKASQFDLDALSNTLLNFSDDEMLLMDDDGREIDKYGLSNLLLDSPSDMNEDIQLMDVSHVDTSVAPETDLQINNSASTTQLDKGDVPDGNGVDTCGLASVSEEPNPSSVCNTDPQVLELCKGVICCTLNTEVLDVPNNDHVIFPSKSRLASLNRRNLNEVSRRDLPMKSNTHKQASETGLSLVNKELKRFGELHTDSQARVPKMVVNHAGERINKLEMPRSQSFTTNSRPPALASCSTLIVKKLPSEVVPQKISRPDLPEVPSKNSDGLKSNFETGALGKKKEVQVLPAVKKLVVNTQSETADEVLPEADVKPLLSDVEEEPSDEDDDDIPYFSDIESVILDMDLAPGDLDSYTSRLVAVYQNEEAKRAIIRLEQGAHASMQRSIASHGALAVLYGRHSKHYIKKPEVLLGRATEDVFVDIDLAKEGRANKISRRQAIIKLDEDGAFHLRNLGKCPILVDDKEVYPGQSVILHSNCLIEVREMPFIFEFNEARVKQYLDAISSNLPPK